MECFSKSFHTGFRMFFFPSVYIVSFRDKALKNFFFSYQVLNISFQLGQLLTTEILTLKIISNIISSFSLDK